MPRARPPAPAPLQPADPMTSATAPSLDQALAAVAADIDARFDRLLAVPDDPRADLYKAMRHAAIGGGKRLRPLLLCATADLFGVDRDCAGEVAMAVEAIHVYSLIHDDLPAMDDDDMRRGKPTVHKAFDEATAILAGDCLHALAFEVLADPETHADPFVRAELVMELARASGPSGMGAILGRVPPEGRRSLRGYAHDLGLAFQIADDLLDAEGDEAVVGKALRKDGAAGKETFLSLLGVDRARDQCRMLVDQAIAHLHGFGPEADVLRAIARYVVERDR
jgi:farnesyl diphosphate synthase